MAPNVLAYGKDVAEADRIAIATAFVKAGFPLRAMGPAKKVNEAKLIQVIASSAAERECAVLTIEEILANKECGGRP